ncbi:hypothetical protein NQ315_005732, partial [Exocentrus adspersus]
MVLGTRSKCRAFHDQNLQVKINGEGIEYVNEIKYLGVVIDPQMSFHNHINYICKKNRIPEDLSFWSKLLVYNTIIFPHFNYCMSLLLSCTKEDVGRLQILQNRAMRVILGCNRYTSIGVMLDDLKWLNVVQIIEQSNLVLIYRI